MIAGSKLEGTTAKRCSPIRAMAPDRAVAPDRRPVADQGEAERTRLGGGG
jgi:hypothetical protein